VCTVLSGAVTRTILARRPMRRIDDGLFSAANDSGTERCPIRHRLLSREILQPQLQDADRFATAGDRREQPSAVILDDQLDLRGSRLRS
jgi:hypothetical protein